MNLFQSFLKGPSFEEGIQQAAETPKALLLDVRSAEEYRQGHVPGSKNIPLDRITEFSADRETPIFVYCLSGARSGRACAFLKGKGYRVTNIGGISGYQGKLE